MEDQPHPAQLLPACSCTLTRVHVSGDSLHGPLASTWLVPSLVSAVVPPHLRTRGGTHSLLYLAASFETAGITHGKLLGSLRFFNKKIEGRSEIIMQGSHTDSKQMKSISNREQRYQMSDKTRSLRVYKLKRFYGR